MDGTFDAIAFQAIFEHSNVGIIMSDDSGKIIKINPFASQMFGYENEELVSQEIDLLLPNRLRKKHVSQRNSYYKSPVSRPMGKGLDLLALRKNGEEFYVEISLSYYKINNQLQVICFVYDITEKKRIKDALKDQALRLETRVEERTSELSRTLEQLNKVNLDLQQEVERRKEIEKTVRQALEKEKELNDLKSRFVSMASHEFRTPLSGIMTSASLLEKYTKTEDQSKRDRHLSNIKKSVRNLTSILNDFLSLDKLEQGGTKYHPVEFIIEDFIKELVEEFKLTSRASNELVFICESSDTTILQDQEIIRNILANLLSNAIKYSPEDSPVEISLNLINENVILNIKDFGCGIPDEDQKHMFEKFFRAGNVTAIQGTGLGLNIVSRYTEIIGGKISFTSKVGEGTCFSLEIPWRKENEKNITN